MSRELNAPLNHPILNSSTLFVAVRFQCRCGGEGAGDHAKLEETVLDCEDCCLTSHFAYQHCLDSAQIDASSASVKVQVYVFETMFAIRKVAVAMAARLMCKRSVLDCEL